MNKKILTLILSCLLALLALFATSCSEDNTPYGGYTEDGYTVSVKFDANGGVFTTNTKTIIDTYDLSKYQTNSEGQKEIKLFAPNDGIRGNQAYTAEKVDYYLAGWYKNRTEVVGENGKISYEYGGLWNFDTDRLSLDPDKEYDAGEPVITLYAAWVPAFKYEFYTFNDKGVAELIGTISKNPTADTSLLMPALNESTGKLGDNNGFPALDGKTYDKIYADEAKTQQITGTKLTHTGVFNKETAELENPVMKVYCTTLDGLWFEVDTPEKIIKNPYLNAHYILKCDIDFTGKYWPATLCTANFKGSVIGNGYSIKNVTLTQNDNSSVNYGLFGQITGGASLTDVTFDGITVNIERGSRMQGASFGILAGIISSDAEISGVTLKNSKFVISQNRVVTSFVVNVSSYGFVSGTGSLEGITFSENNTLAFAGNGPTEYEFNPDSEGRFTLTEKKL